MDSYIAMRQDHGKSKAEGSVIDFRLLLVSGVPWIQVPISLEGLNTQAPAKSRYSVASGGPCLR